VVVKMRITIRCSGHSTRCPIVCSSYLAFSHTIGHRILCH